MASIPLALFCTRSGPAPSVSDKDEPAPRVAPHGEAPSATTYLCASPKMTTGFFPRKRRGIPTAHMSPLLFYFEQQTDTDGQESVSPPSPWVVAPYYPWGIHHRSGRAKRLLVTAARPPRDDPLLLRPSCQGGQAGRGRYKAGTGRAGPGHHSRQEKCGNS